MAETPETQSGRDKLGRFAPGSSGRWPGTRNQITLDLAEIRQRIVDSWKSCNGNALLKQVAKDQPLEYLKLIVKLLPRPIEGDGTGTQIIIVVRSDAGMAFAETLQEQAQRLPALEGTHIIEALRTVNPGLDFNGVNDGNGDNGDERPQLPADDPNGD